MGELERGRGSYQVRFPNNEARPALPPIITSFSRPGAGDSGDRAGHAGPSRGPTRTITVRTLTSIKKIEIPVIPINRPGRADGSRTYDRDRQIPAIPIGGRGSVDRRRGHGRGASNTGTAETYPVPTRTVTVRTFTGIKKVRVPLTSAEAATNMSTQQNPHGASSNSNPFMLLFTLFSVGVTLVIIVVVVVKR